MTIPNLIDEHWQSDAIKRANALFPNQGIQATAAIAARTHRFSIDYLEQAPAALVFATWGTTPQRYAERALIAQRWGSAVHRGPKLKDLLADFQAPLPVRKVRGIACIPSNMPAILALRKIPASDLSQAIPDDKGQQLRWFRYLRAWLEHCGRMPFVADFNPMWHWAVKAGGAAIQEGFPNVEGRAGDIFDFLTRGKGRLQPNWTFKAALRATERWHEELAAKQDQERFLTQHGFRFDQTRDYAPLPDTAAAGGYEFVALRSGLDLFLEGRAMRHCVASYVREVMLGGTRIYSIRKDDERVATLELHPRGERFVPHQLKGHCNAKPLKQVAKAAEAFLAAANEGIRA